MKEQAEEQNAEEMHKRRSQDWGYMGETEIYEGFR
jgi:hypothetical protein